MASLAKCLRQHVPEEADREAFLRLAETYKSAGAENNLSDAVFQFIDVAENERETIVSQIVEQGGTRPEYGKALLKLREPAAEEAKVVPPTTKDKPLSLAERKAEADNAKNTAETISKIKAGETVEGVKLAEEEPTGPNPEIAEEMERVPFLDTQEEEGATTPVLSAREQAAEVENKRILDGLEESGERKGWQGKKDPESGMMTRRKDDWVLVQASSKRTLLSKSEEGKRVDYGTFNNQAHAMDAAEQGINAEEFYRKEKEAKKAERDKAKTELSEEKTRLLAESNTDKIVAAAKVKMQVGEEFDDVVRSSIIESARKFDIKKTGELTGTAKQKFEKYAIGNAIASIKNETKNPESTTADAVSEGSGEGSERVSKKDSVTAGQIKGAVPLKTEETVSVRASDAKNSQAPMKKLTKNPAGFWIGEDGKNYGPLKGKAVDAYKKKVVAQAKKTVKTVTISDKEQKAILEKQKESRSKPKPIQKTVEEKVDEAETVDAEEAAKIKREEELKELIDLQAMDMTDEVIHEREDGADTFDDVEVEDQSPTEDTSFAREEAGFWIEKYRRASGGDVNLGKAMQYFEQQLYQGNYLGTEAEANLVRQEIKNKQAAADFMIQHFENKYKSGKELLEKAATAEDPATRQLAKMLLSNMVIKNKLSKVSVEKVAAELGFSSYNSRDNKIKVGVPTEATLLHEVVHAITVNEMASNPQLKKEVTKMLDVARFRAIAAEDLVGLRHGTLRFIEGAQTSQAFKNDEGRILQGLTAQERQIAYGLLNEKEFLSQAFSSKEFQEFLKTIEVEKPARLKQKGAWNAFKDFVAKVGRALRLDPNKFTLLEQAITIVPELGKVSVTLKEDGTSQALEAKKTDAQRVKVMRDNDKRGKPVDIAKDWLKKAGQLGKDIGQSVTEAIRKINPRLIRPLRQMEFRISNKNAEYQEKVKGFLMKYSKMSADDQRLLDLALMNQSQEGYKATRDKIIKKYGAQKDYAKVEEVLEEIWSRGGETGINEYGAKKDYFPRRVKDVRQLLKTIQGDPDYGAIQAEIDALGEEATQVEKEEALRKIVNTGRYPAIALLKPSSAQKRTIKTVSSEWKHHYENTHEALVNHIYEMNESISIREFFVDSKRRKFLQERDSLYARLEDKKFKGKRREKAVGRLMEVEELLADKNQEFRDAIGEMLVREAPGMPAEQQDEVINLFRARLAQKGMTGAPSAFRNVALMAVLGSPTSAITQIGDLAFSVHRSGLVNTLSSLFDKKLVTANDLDLVGGLKEFQSEGSAKWLDKTLKWSGLQWADKTFKETTMQASIKQAQKMSLAQFKKKFEHAYQQDTEQTWKDLKAGKSTDLTKYFAFNELSNWQPVSLSEMPKKYLTAGNGRIFYMLKSYNIKALNNIIRETVGGYQSAKTTGERAKALASAGKLITLMAVMGATADELKDMLTGNVDDDTFSDKIHENLLKTAFMSRYTLSKGFSSDLPKAIMADIITPPMSFVWDPFRDVHSVLTGDNPDFRTSKYLPLIGKVGYKWLSPADEKRQMNRLKERFIGDYIDGSSLSKVRKSINTYNAWARKNKEKIVTFSTLAKAKQRSKKAELNKKRA